MKMFLSYWFWPNPAGWHYSDQKVAIVFGVCAAFILLSFVIRFWRSKHVNPMTKSLSRSWSSASFWFGLSALILTVSRVETIQFLSMRLLWALWVLAFALSLLFQIIQFRRRHYTVMERIQIVDEREKYLPRKKVR